MDFIFIFIHAHPPFGGLVNLSSCPEAVRGLIREVLGFDPEPGYDIRTVRELLDYASVEMTKIYPHVLNRGGKGSRAP
jgi:hypothetical protein